MTCRYTTVSLSTDYECFLNALLLSGPAICIRDKPLLMLPIFLSLIKQILPPEAHSSELEAVLQKGTKPDDELCRKKKEISSATANEDTNDLVITTREGQMTIYAEKFKGETTTKSFVRPECPSLLKFALPRGTMSHR